MRLVGSRGRLSVRSHLALIVAVVSAVFVVAGVGLGYQAWQNAKRTVTSDAALLADRGAHTVAQSVAAAREHVTAIASNPAAASLLADPAACALDFGLVVFPGSHLDLVRRDGSVACSSADLPADGAVHRGAAWLDAPRTAPAGASTLFTDGVTGLPAIALVAGVQVDGEEVGTVAVVVPTQGVAQVITETFGGRHFRFALVDADDVLLSSAREVDARRVGAAVADPMSGTLFESHPVDGTPWLVYAGADPADALAPTRSLLLRGALLGGGVLLVLAGSMWIVNRRIARPLRALTDAVALAGSRHGTALPEIGGPSEIQLLAAEFKGAIAERDAYESQLSHLALHDPLTGLANRALLIERLTDALERAGAGRASVAVLFIDLDRFKLVNESLGHDIGDGVLIEVARRVRAALPPSATLARFGGDEFVVVVDDCAAVELDRFIDDLLATVVAPIETKSAVVRVTASIGVATGGVSQRAIDLLRAADNAMYTAKDRGRGRAERFTGSLHDHAAAHLAMASELRVALDRDELDLVYQPKIDLTTGAVVGVEALVRWEHPALGSVPPSTFIPIAEESDTIIRIGEFVLERACHQARAWLDNGIDLTVAVNISGRQLIDGELPLQVATALAVSGLPAGSLYLELTETLLMADTFATQHNMDELHELGVRLSIDDFGTGYSSLAYLHRFPVDELKIDRSFISELTSSPHRAPLISAMISMGKSLGLEIVAEGVETPEQASRLRALGCDKAQGYLFARPQPADAIAALCAPNDVRA